MQLDSYLYQKLTNDSCRFHSPSKMMNKDNCTFPYGGKGLLQQNCIRLGIQYAEKMSLRFDKLKSEDPILDYDIIDLFFRGIS